MIVPSIGIEQSGPGVDLSNQPAGLAIEMSDPAQDLEYARNAVTLTYDLSGIEHLRLLFEAREYGDEPHAPPPGPFGDNVNFDGVAVSADGVNWYEIQDLRHLRSDKFTAYNIDLDALVAGLGLSYGSAFRIRFCQYDDNPAPMDGFSIQGIRVDGVGRAPVLHLTMDDNAASAVVLDSAAGGHHQTFLDSTGDPNTSAHTAPGRVGTALSFDGVNDRIILSSDSYRPFLEAGQNFTIALWWKTNAPTASQQLYFLTNTGAQSCIVWYTSNGNVVLRVSVVGTETRILQQSFSGGVDGQWHHYALTRRGTVFSFYRDGVLALSNNHPENTLSLAPAGQNLTIASNETTSRPSPGFADDFRLYDRALFASEIQALAGA